MAMTSRQHTYEGQEITVTYERKRCIHVAECGHGLPTVFDVSKRPWVQPDQATVEEVMDTVLRCPTGALKFERKDSGSEKIAPEGNTISVAENGPLFVAGDVTITTQDGSISLHETRSALCRCGASANKPFCDNAHQKIEFQAEGTVIDNQSDSADNAIDGALKVVPAANGPLLLQGNFEIQSADGEALYRGNKAALCRCGASTNKPFCDGTHKAVGFEAE